jgi:hypothetical protein
VIVVIGVARENAPQFMQYHLDAFTLGIAQIVPIVAIISDFLEALRDCSMTAEVAMLLPTLL